MGINEPIFHYVGVKLFHFLTTPMTFLHQNFAVVNHFQLIKKDSLNKLSFILDCT